MAASFPALRPEFVPSHPPRACPIHTSLATLGRKWSLEILRDVTFYEGVRFSDFIRLSPGLTPRVLSRRLSELEAGGFVEKRRAASRGVAYALTPKGRDVVPVLAALVDFGIRHEAGTVFADGRARSLDRFMPAGTCELLGRFKAYADGVREGGPPRPAAPLRRRVGRPRRAPAGVKPRTSAGRSR